MNIKDKLEELALANGWSWDYGRSDYHNIRDAKDFKADTDEGFSNDETILFCDPIRTSKVRATNQVQSIGQMILLTRSNHDKMYSERYDLFIEPLKAALDSMYNKLRCEWEITRWEDQEVINFFDYNADGLIINFTVIGNG